VLGRSELITMILQVWVAKEDVKKKLEEIPIPFSDVKNILEDIHFKDELTRSRCRGWLVFPSRRYLQADILFPGCEFDCRLTIRGRSGGFAEVIFSSSISLYYNPPSIFVCTRLVEMRHVTEYTLSV